MNTSPIKSICVYCGSNLGLSPEYAGAARLVGRTLAEAEVTLVYGGGNSGLMGQVANAALEAGGKVIGVMPERLIVKEVAHTGLTELHAVGSMHERKTLMAELSDAFIALPGGIGTLEEIFEVYTWTQLGFQTKPCAFLNVAGYYSGLFAFLDHAVSQNFVRQEHLEMLVRTDEIGEILRRFREYVPVTMTKWVDKV